MEPAPLLVLDSESRIITANPSFHRMFRMSPREAEGQLLYSISNGRWNLPRLREMLERILSAHKMVRTSKSNRISQLSATEFLCLALDNLMAVSRFF
jgi:PAS domain-containing protein